MKILITGGAGFIGRHVIEKLQGHEITVLDSFEPIVHGLKPCWKIDGAEVIKGRVENLDLVRNIVKGCSAVIHLAAGVSLSASFEEPSRFVRTNSLGTAVLWEAIHGNSRVEHVTVASSMSVYGEGSSEFGIDENWPCKPRSIYGLSKLECERISLLCGDLYDIPVTALRIWNTYGPGQSLTNSETGVVPIFASKILSGQAPIVYEDGEQVRDFIHVDDVARCFALAIEKRTMGVFNAGTGKPTSVLSVAKTLCDLLSDSKVEPHVNHTKRPGDVRHCWPDLTRARDHLGWKAVISLEEGLASYSESLSITKPPPQISL